MTMGTTIGGTQPPTISTINVPDTAEAGAPSTTTAGTQSRPAADSQPDARQAEASKQHANDNKPQNDVRAGYVQQQLDKAYKNSMPKAPDPNKYVPKDAQDASANTTTKKEEPYTKATTFGPSTSAVQDAGRLSPNVEYQKLPEDLKSKMTKGLWDGLETRQRATLVDTYSRMKSYGLWDEVKSVTGQKEAPEKHVKIGKGEYEVAGNSGSIIYQVKDAQKFQDKMVETGRLGLDDGFMGKEHAGQRSYRESSKTDSKSLHVSVGPGNQIDAHIDKISPVNVPEDGKTSVNWQEGVEHQRKELIPEKIRKKTGGAGIIIDKPIQENRDAPHGAEIKIGVSVEIHGPVKEKSVGKGDSLQPAPEQMLNKINQRLDKSNVYFPTPIGSNPDHVPEPKEVAKYMAAQMIDAARRGETRINMDIPDYMNNKQDQARVLDEMRKIGEIVRSEMIAANPNLESVRSMTVTFGTYNQGGTVPVAN